MPGLDHFGLIAPYYDRAIPFARKERLMAMAKLPAEGKLLDLGGGTGRVAQALAPEVSQIVVADESLGMLRQAVGKPGCNPISTLAEQLPFPSNCFERVIMVDAYHHVLDQEWVTAEMWRVLKPCGRIVIEEPDIRTWGARLIAVFEKVLLMRSHFVAPEGIARNFKDSQAKISIEEDHGSAWVMVDKEM
jgi:ubiquinone/menaquinone biosynthesis C-methylase UbiE